MEVSTGGICYTSDVVSTVPRGSAVPLRELGVRACHRAGIAVFHHQLHAATAADSVTSIATPAADAAAADQAARTASPTTAVAVAHPVAGTAAPITIAAAAADRVTANAVAANPVAGTAARVNATAVPVIFIPMLPL